MSVCLVEIGTGVLKRFFECCQFTSIEFYVMLRRQIERRAKSTLIKGYYACSYILLFGTLASVSLSLLWWIVLKMLNLRLSCSDWFVFYDISSIFKLYKVGECSEQNVIITSEHVPLLQLVHVPNRVLYRRLQPFDMSTIFKPVDRTQKLNVLNFNRMFLSV